jgi:hypothetical protein
LTEPQMPLPAIMHWQGNHWIVLYDVDAQRVRIAGPAIGLRCVSRVEFEASGLGTSFRRRPEGTNQHTDQERRMAMRQEERREAAGVQIPDLPEKELTPEQEAAVRGCGMADGDIFLMLELEGKVTVGSQCGLPARVG